MRLYAQQRGRAPANGSLVDGRYTIAVLGNKISTGGVFLDGDGTGPGSNATAQFHRFFGNINGDGFIAAGDFAQFRLAFNGSNPLFDFDGDGSVSANDFGEFRMRFGGAI